jgi:quinol monooxygenase YgiN
MIKRIVKMSFDPARVNEFKAVYRQNWTKIKSFEGCEHVELLQAETEKNIFFTFSIWLSEEHLDLYRNSDLFKTIWASTKILFNDKPHAWTVMEITF